MYQSHKQVNFWSSNSLTCTDSNNQSLKLNVSDKEQHFKGGQLQIFNAYRFKVTVKCQNRVSQASNFIFALEIELESIHLEFQDNLLISNLSNIEQIKITSQQIS